MPQFSHLDISKSVILGKFNAKNLLHYFLETLTKSASCMCHKRVFLWSTHNSAIRSAGDPNGERTKAIPNHSNHFKSTKTFQELKYFFRSGTGSGPSFEEEAGGIGRVDERKLASLYGVLFYNRACRFLNPTQFLRL